MYLIPDELKYELKEKTGGLLKENSKEIQLFCPYCDDAYRRPNPKHGHLYIGKENLLFICFRCGEKGHLFKLLNYLQIPPEKYFKGSDLKRIKIISKISRTELREKNNETNFLKNNEIEIFGIKFPKHKNFVFLKIRETKSEEVEKTKKYIFKRTGIENFNLFFSLNFFPWIDSVLFFNLKNFLFQIRFLSEKMKSKYFFVLNKILDINNLTPLEKYFGYYLNFEKRLGDKNFHDLVFAEGAFDIINIFQKNRKNYFGDFISIRGSFYQKVLSEFLFFNFNFRNLIFYLDGDINERKLIYRLRNEIKKFVKFYFSHFSEVPEFYKKGKLILIKNPLFKDFGEIKNYSEKIIFDEKISELI